jgi:hypothetical protein
MGPSLRTTAAALILGGTLVVATQYVAREQRETSIWSAQRVPRLPLGGWFYAVTDSLGMVVGTATTVTDTTSVAHRTAHREQLRLLTPSGAYLRSARMEIATGLDLRSFGAAEWSHRATQYQLAGVVQRATTARSGFGALAVDIRAGDRHGADTVRLDGPPFVPELIPARIVLFGSPQVGARYVLPVFDPAPGARRVLPRTITILARDTLSEVDSVVPTAVAGRYAAARERRLPTWKIRLATAHVPDGRRASVLGASVPDGEIIWWVDDAGVPVRLQLNGLRWERGPDELVIQRYHDRYPTPTSHQPTRLRASR